MTDDQPIELSCEMVDELAGVIALGALEPDELASASAHLATCDQPHDDVRELLGADRALALVLEPRAGKGRLTQNIRVERGRTTAVRSSEGEAVTKKSW